MPKAKSESVRLFGSILCPIDFSKPARKALRTSAALAQQTSARLTVLFVKDQLLEAAGAIAYDERALRKSTENELRKFGESSLAGSGDSSLRPEYLVTSGDAAEQIHTTAKKLKVDLVVMGTHGLTGLTKVVFGSTTEKFLRLATVPVLLIPPTGRS